MELVNVTELEDMAGTLAASLIQAGSINTPEEAAAYAKTLAVLKLNVVETLSDELNAWSLRNGPVFIDDKHEQAYAHWKKETTVVKDEASMWEFLSARGTDIEALKRPDLPSLKSLLDSEDGVVGLERYVGTDVSYMFGLKKNLTKRPRKSMSEAGEQEIGMGTRYQLGKAGVKSVAKVVSFVPSVAPVVTPSCGVMPPARVTACAPVARQRRKPAGAMATAARSAAGAI